jgi:hypothetical protein
MADMEGQRKQNDSSEEIDERLGDLWSMSQKEQDRFSRVILVATVGFVLAFACVFYVVVSG